MDADRLDLEMRRLAPTLSVRSKTPVAMQVGDRLVPVDRVEFKSDGNGGGVFILHPPAPPATQDETLPLPAEFLPAEVPDAAAEQRRRRHRAVP